MFLKFKKYSWSFLFLINDWSGEFCFNNFMAAPIIVNLFFQIILAVFFSSTRQLKVEPSSQIICDGL